MKTTCCVVGAGPAGIMLSYLLARQGVDVVLVEAQKDFDRDFRGDTLHPSVMENLEQLGLVDELLKLPHTKSRGAWFRVQGKEFRVLDFKPLDRWTKYPYITLMPQERFLNFMAEHAKKFDGFHLLMNTKVVGLLQEGNRVHGVEVESSKGRQNIEADLVIGADGRFSTVRKLAELALVSTAPPMDVIWFKLPKKSGDPEIEGVMGHLAPGDLVAQLDRGNHWQFGGIVPKGELSELHGKGIDGFQDRLIAVLPEVYSDRIRQLKDWKQLGVFKVDFGRVKRWYKDGLLLIGDAAHVMSPVGGVGINYAIQDAVVAANVLVEPLKNGKLTVADLAKVQKKRLWPTRVVQWFQSIAHKFFIKQALRPDKPLRAPWFARFAFVRSLAVRFIAFGLWRVKVKLES